MTLAPETEAQLRATLASIERLVDELAKIATALRPELERAAKRRAGYHS